MLLTVVLIPSLNAVGMHYSLSTLIAFIVIAITGFVLHCTLTFNVERTFSGFLRYFFAMMLNLPITIILLGVMHDAAGLSVAISTVITSILLTMWNFMAVKWALMRRLNGAHQ